MLPNEVNPLMLGGGGYQISRSLRFRSAAGAKISRTPGVAGNQQTWTWSGWVKRGSLGSSQQIFVADNSSTLQSRLHFLAADTLEFISYNAALQLSLITTQVFRDTSAWYHIVLTMDTTQATASNRARIYINGSQVTAFSTATYPAQNYNGIVNQVLAHYHGAYFSTLEYLDGYLTEINFIDGQSLTPSSFGEFDATTGVWKPKKYTGTYGTNGFYLNFSNNSAATAAAIGADYSGNGNNWTPTNINVATANTNYDSTFDVPTPYSDGGNGRGNYCVMNPLDQANQTASGGNLNTVSNNSAGRIRGSLGVTSGKWYFEHTLTAYANGGSIGVMDLSSLLGTSDVGNGSASNAASWGYLTNTGNKLNNTTSTAYGTASTTNDVVMCALDLDNSKIWWGKNGTWFASGDPVAGTNAAFTNVTGYTLTPTVGLGATSVQSWAHNFGQRPFAYTVPSGFKTLNTSNLPAPTIKNGSKYFATNLWTGTGTSPNTPVTGLSFAPDFVWLKVRNSATYFHMLADTIRGAGKSLNSNSTQVEQTNDVNGYLSAFNTDGFTVAAGATSQQNVNVNTSTYVAWQWNGGGSTVTNTTGTISAQVRANPTAGFSIITYTGTGANATIGHGLGVAPKMVIVKSRSAVTSWNVWHTGIPAANFLLLEATSASAADATKWNSTVPTSSVFSVGTQVGTNASAVTFAAYCFAEVAGYSKIGSWQNNNSTDGTFVYLGFRPSFVMLKNSDNTEAWYIEDSKRQTYNYGPANTNFLNPNSAALEAGAISGANAGIDFLSNGFKIRTTNTAAGEIGFGTRNYIYLAIAENPFKYSLAR